MTALAEPIAAPPRLDCPTILAAGMAAAGYAVTVSRTAPTIHCSPWEPWVCPHGGHYWMTPVPAGRGDARGAL